MECPKCKKEAVYNEVLGKGFYYCRDCKEEVKYPLKQDFLYKSAIEGKFINPSIIYPPLIEQDDTIQDFYPPDDAIQDLVADPQMSFDFFFPDSPPQDKAIQAAINTVKKHFAKAEIEDAEGFYDGKRKEYD